MGLRLLVLASAPFGLAACVSGDRVPQEQAPSPAFDAIAFFAGHTVGEGRLRVAMHSADRTHVDGVGQIDADRSIVLDQTVRRGNRPPTHRRWNLRMDAPGHYVGTLSDAAGPVTGEVRGNRLHLAFAMRGGLRADQWLYLASDGQVAHNVMIVRKLGLRVARLDETITKVPG